MAENAIERGEKQRSLHDKLQNDRIDTIANLSDSASAKKQKADERAATEAAEVAARQLAAAKRDALVEELKVEDEIADFEAQLARDLKTDQDIRNRLEEIKTKTAKIELENAINQAEGATRKRQAELDKIAEKNAAIARAQQNLDWAAENLKQQKIKESALQRKDDVANRIEKIEKIKERNEMWADINDNNAKILATQKFADDRASIEDPVRPAYEPGVSNNQSQYEIANQRIVEVTKEAEQDAQNKTTKVDMEKTIGELAAERAERERLAELHNQQINSTTADDIADVKPSKCSCTTNGRNTCSKLATPKKRQQSKLIHHQKVKLKRNTQHSRH